ncbi:MAG: DMT family transporter [Deltaproteobacteria bacterium]|nr:DMT family transporter [Deltaproteobacteria bacterium]MCW5806053.1 DMT family transporter [Deltaproteobacteria bacterium]
MRHLVHVIGPVLSGAMTPWYVRWMPARGVLYMVVSALGFSAMSMLVKVASETLPIGEIVVARGLVTLALSYAMIVRADLDPWGTSRRGKLVLRGLLGFGGLALYYIALARLPLADATVLHHTTPILTTLLAWRLLGERVGWPTAVALGCGIAGVLAIVHPTTGGIDALGVGAALAGALCSAVAYVTVRQLARTENPLVIVFYFPLVATPLAIPWALADWVTPSPRDVLLLLAIGATTQLGQVYLTKALAIERAGRATSVGYLQVAFAMMWQLAIFGTAPTVATVFGAALIIVGTLTVARFGTAERATPSPTSSPPPS